MGEDRVTCLSPVAGKEISRRLMAWRRWRCLWRRIPMGQASPDPCQHQVPLGTYTGWNTVASGFYKGQIRTNTGSFIPFARTKAERLASGDPRLSLEERYGTHKKYVAQVRAAAERLVRGRYLLQDDADRLIEQAEASKVLR